MRGKVQGLSVSADNPRITPAYAGKSISASNPYSSIRDHPRLCGEKGECIMAIDFKKGSPPPMRGKVPHSFVHHLSTRITPAYAGKRLVLCGLTHAERDHPRLCGEKLGLAFRSVKILGSPPPMRGKVCEWISRHKIAKDHPRLCGEKSICIHENTLCQGSPPPMRGKGWDLPRPDAVRGITPAYAGKSFKKGRSRTRNKDHPRLCGEKLRDTVRQIAD